MKHLLSIDLVPTSDSRMSNSEIIGEHFVYPNNNKLIIGQLELIDNNGICKLICKNYDNFHHILHIPFSRLFYVRVIADCVCTLLNSDKTNCEFNHDDKCIQRPIFNSIPFMFQCFLADLQMIPTKCYIYESKIYLTDEKVTARIDTFLTSYINNKLFLDYPTYMFTLLNEDIIKLRETTPTNQLKLF